MLHFGHWLRSFIIGSIFCIVEFNVLHSHPDEEYPPVTVMAEPAVVNLASLTDESSAGSTVTRALGQYSFLFLLN